MTEHTINENETDQITEKKENENLEDLFAEVEQLIAHMEEDISLDESFVCFLGNNILTLMHGVF